MFIFCCLCFCLGGFLLCPSSSSQLPCLLPAAMWVYCPLMFFGSNNSSSFCCIPAGRSACFCSFFWSLVSSRSPLPCLVGALVFLLLLPQHPPPPSTLSSSSSSYTTSDLLAPGDDTPDPLSNVPRVRFFKAPFGKAGVSGSKSRRSGGLLY